MSREKNGIEGKIWLQVPDRWAGEGLDGGAGRLRARGAGGRVCAASGTERCFVPLAAGMPAGPTCARFVAAAGRPAPIVPAQDPMESLPGRALRQGLALGPPTSCAGAAAAGEGVRRQGPASPPVPALWRLVTRVLGECQ